MDHQLRNIISSKIINILIMHREILEFTVFSYVIKGFARFAHRLTAMFNSAKPCQVATPPFCIFPHFGLNNYIVNSQISQFIKSRATVIFK